MSFVDHPREFLTLALPPLDRQHPLDVKREDFEEEEEYEINLPLFVQPQAERPSELTPPNVVAGVLSELAPDEEVAKSVSKT